jgi:acyl carrier protein
MSDKLTEMFARVLKVPLTGLNDDSSPDTVDKWDSLAAMRLVATIEETFSVRLTTTEIMTMDSIGAARVVLKGKGVAAV